MSPLMPTSIVTFMSSIDVTPPKRTVNDLTSIT
jgi:hypothetical protein